MLLMHCASAEPEIHLIEKGYTGPVVIEFDVSDGAPKEYDGKSRVYRIPTCGILKTQFESNPGTFVSNTRKACYYDRDSNVGFPKVRPVITRVLSLSADKAGITFQTLGHEKKPVYK